MEGTPELHGVAEKIEFYTLGLTFTLLVLAVQTFKPTTSLPADIVEIIGWMALLLSGLLGMSRIEWIPIILHVKGRESFLEEAKRDLAKTKTFGTRGVDSQTHQPSDVNEVMAVATKSLEEVKMRGGSLDRKNWFKYRWQRGAFLVGLVAILLVRAQGVIHRVIERIM
jgi:hypothetical protein